MKTEIVKIEPVNKEIDWSKRQLLKHKDELYVLYTGTHTDSCFSGYVIYNNKMNPDFADYLNTFDKDSFTPITEPITIKFIP